MPRKTALPQIDCLPGVSHQHSLDRIARGGAVPPGPRNAGGWISPRMAAAHLLRLCLSSSPRNGFGLPLLCCGDIQPNPGPEGTPMDCDHPDAGASFLERHRDGHFIQLASQVGQPSSSSSSSSAAEVSVAVSAAGHLAASSGRNARVQGAVPCPFEGCPYSRKQLPKATLVSHLSARHVSAGQTVPAVVLQMLRHTCCLRCKTLRANGTACQCQAPLPPNDADQPPSQVAPPEVPPATVPPGTSTPLANVCPDLVPPLDAVLAARYRPLGTFQMLAGVPLPLVCRP